MRQFTDEELTAYLDGEAEPDLVKEIDCEFAARPDLNQRLRDLDIDRDEIAGAFHRLLDTAPGMPDLPEFEGTGDAVAGARSSGGMRVRAIAAMAACVALLALGAGAGYLVSETRNAGWRSYVAAYQALYVGGTLSHLKSSPAEQVSELGRVSKALGRPFDLAALQHIEQLDYKRAQTLGFEGRPLVQLAFMSKLGAPVALCIIRSGEASSRDMEVRYEMLEGMRAAWWRGNGFEYLLIGGTDAELIRTAATYFAGVL